MKARPVKVVVGVGYVAASIEDATYLTLNFPGPVGLLTLPVIRSGSRDDSGSWTWNGDVEKPTIRPSVLTTMEHKGLRCHTWVNDGKAQFLAGLSHASGFIEESPACLKFDRATRGCNHQGIALCHR